MTNEERDIINQFIGRVGGAPAGGQANAWGGSVPATQAQPALPPVDPEADAFIRQSFQRCPEAPYRITQLAFVQEHALAEAQNRIKRLEWELQQAAQQAQQAAQQAPQQAQGGGGFFSGLFGGRPQQPQPGPSPAWNQNAPPPQYQQAPPPPQYPPNYQPSMFQRSGSGFLGSALTTAAGVAGGVMAADALMGLFHHGAGGGFGGGYPGYGAPGVESPWGGAMPAAGAAPGQDYVDQGTWDNSGGGQSNQGVVDNGSWDQPTDTSGGGDANWDTSGGGGGWDSSGGDAGGGSDSSDSGSSDSLC
jgi:hypothetical protein